MVFAVQIQAAETRRKTYTEKTVMDIKDGRIYRFQPLKHQRGWGKK
jgi:hypothetical protein